MPVSISRREEVPHDFTREAYDHRENKATRITCAILALYCVPGLSYAHLLIHSFTLYLQLAMKMADRIPVLIDFTVWVVMGECRQTANEYRRS